MTRILSLVLAAALALPAGASAQVVSDRDTFLQAVEGKRLTRLLASLVVTGDGRIVGTAAGGEVTGTWNWEGGYFCRVLNYNGEVYDPMNCQQVTIDGSNIRFQSDRGAGDFLDFTIR